MDISAAASTARLFEFANANDLTNGITLGDPFTVNTRANIAFKVTVTAANQFFDFVAGGVSTLPVNKLYYSVNSGGFVQLVHTGLDLTGITATPGANSFTVDYRMDPGVDAPPGEYTTVLTYTISAQ